MHASYATHAGGSGGREGSEAVRAYIPHTLRMHASYATHAGGSGGREGSEAGRRASRHYFALLALLALLVQKCVATDNGRSCCGSSSCGS